jgi:hypothetical protein
MGVIMMKLDSNENEFFWWSCNWIIMNYIVYTVNCNCTTHATCSLAFTMYKYDKLQMVIATQKLSYKSSCKMPLFS